MRVEFSSDAWNKTIIMVREHVADPLGLKAGTDSRFVARSQVYITQQIDAMIREGGGIQEGESRTLRGADWKGWASKPVARPAYGGYATVGTRSYERKRSRTQEQRAVVLDAFGGEAAAAYEDRGRTWSAKQRKLLAGTPVADRPYEKVWKERASGALYTQSSQLMQDTGALRRAIFNVSISMDGNTIEFRPDVANVPYLERQNELRPFWFLEPKDEVAIAGFAQERLDDIAQAITDGKEL